MVRHSRNNNNIDIEYRKYNAKCQKVHLFLSGLKKKELNKSFILKISTTIKFNKGSLENVSTLVLYSKYSTLFNSA